MPQYSYSKLIGRIIEKYGTRAIFSKKIGISEHTLSKKLTGKQEWRQSEIAKACKLLDIDSQAIPDYFFVRIVQKY